MPNQKLIELQQKTNELISMQCPCGEHYSLGAFIEHAKECRIISGPAGVWAYISNVFHYKLAEARKKGD